MTNFSELLGVAPRATTDAATFELAVTEAWLQGKAAFGGLQGAIGLRTMRAAVGPELPLRALQVVFVSAADPGPLRADAQVVRRGRAITHVQCTLANARGTVALLLGLFGASRPSGARLDMAPPADVKPPGVLREVPFMPGVMPDFLRHFRQRWAGGAVPYTGQPYRPSSLWSRLREAAPDEGDPPPALHDAALREAALVALADLPPSPVLSMLARRAPGASLTWLLEPLVDPRTVDPAEWLLLHTETRHAADGYTSQTARLWDERGGPVAVSHQTTAIFD